MFAYTVTAWFDDLRVAEEWIEWLRQKHLAEVLSAGAIDAEVLRIDTPAAIADTTGHQAARCEVRYHFASRDAFDHYVREHADRLRAEGLRLFPPERGIRYERSTAVVEVDRRSE